MKHKQLLLSLVLPVALAACGNPHPGKLEVRPAAPGYKTQAASLSIKATGGGDVLRRFGQKVTFGFAGQADAEQVGSGNVEVFDHATNTSYHGRVTEVECMGNAAIMRGVLTKPDTGTFEATAIDNGEPGSADVFAFNARNVGDELIVSIFGRLEGGNIQVDGFCPVPLP